MIDREMPGIQHWLVSVVREAGWQGAEALRIDADAQVADAWSLTTLACGRTEEELAALVSRHFRLPLAELSRTDLTCARIVPARVARRLNVVPFECSDRGLMVATPEPVGLTAERELGALTARSVTFAVVGPTALSAALDAAYPPSADGERHQIPVLLSDEQATHILVVDDDADTRLLLRTVLQEKGFRVTEADSGPRALELLTEGEGLPHLVTLDLRMPEMDGLEVLRTLRQRMSTRTLPVVVATGAGDPEVEMEVLSAGADDFVVKPLDPPRFLLRVQAVLRRYQASTGLG